MRKLKSLVVIMFFLLIVISLWTYARYLIIYSKAYYSYATSRNDSMLSIDNDEFAKFGIKYGMDEAEVDKIMKNASVKSGRMKQEYPRPKDTKEYVKTYDFRYDPKYTDLFGLYSTYLIEEYFSITFNKEGQVIRVFRNLSMHKDPGRSGNSEWNLVPGS